MLLLKGKTKIWHMESATQFKKHNNSTAHAYVLWNVYRCYSNLRMQLVDREGWHSWKMCFAWKWFTLFTKSESIRETTKSEIWLWLGWSKNVRQVLKSQVGIQLKILYFPFCHSSTISFFNIISMNSWNSTTFIVLIEISDWVLHLTQPNYVKFFIYRERKYLILVELP